MSVHFLSGKVHISRHVVAEALMLCCEQIMIKYQKVSVLACLDRALCIFNSKLLRAVDRIAEDHFFDAHFFAGWFKRLFRTLTFGRLCLFIDPASHTDFNAVIRIPRCEIIKVDIITGPGHKRPAVPDRLAAELFFGALLTEQRCKNFCVSCVPLGRV